MVTEGWGVLMREVLDAEMFVVLDAINSLAINDTEMQLKYAYLKGTLDFIRSIYELEAKVRADVDITDGSFMESLTNKFKMFYRRLTFSTV